jgi:Spy/CpxP family protein refolding chaperone
MLYEHHLYDNKEEKKSIERREKMKRIAVVVFLITCFLATSAYADSPKKSKHHGYDLKAKFFHKVHMAVNNQEELGLTDEQYEKIKTLKTETKKDLIRREAEIDIIGIDIKCKLQEDTIDTKSINKLIDQKYELKKAKSKALVSALATFKNILTEDQKKKLTGIDKKGCRKRN